MKVSVIMPVYNTQDFLEESIKSILNQTFVDFEFIIIDDGSTDNSYQICQKYSEQDSRIKLYRNKKNKGIPYTRNKLIELANTNYIASQDSDDISEPNRLQLEYEFLEKNSGYAVVSGNNIIIDEKNVIIGYREYSDNVKKNILKKSPISQPSSMFRKDMFLKVGGYDKKLDYGEDYDLWLKFIFHGYKIKNLDVDILKYRIRGGQTKSKKLKHALQNTLFIQKRAVEKYNIKLSFSDKIYHFFEKGLLYLPNSFILFLFKKLEYRKGKKQ